MNELSRFHNKALFATNIFQNGNIYNSHVMMRMYIKVSMHYGMCILTARQTDENSIVSFPILITFQDARFKKKSNKKL